MSIFNASSVFLEIAVPLTGQILAVIDENVNVQHWTYRHGMDALDPHLYLDNLKKEKNYRFDVAHQMHLKQGGAEKWKAVLEWTFE